MRILVNKFTSKKLDQKAYHYFMKKELYVISTILESKKCKDKNVDGWAPVFEFFEVHSSLP